MKLKLIAALFATSVIAVFSFSESYSDVSSVKSYSLGETFMRVNLQKMKNVEGCSNQEWYYLNTATDGGRLMASSLITSYVTKSPVSFQLSGCKTSGERKYPIITHIYHCETSWCN